MGTTTKLLTDWSVADLLLFVLGLLIPCVLFLSYSKYNGFDFFGDIRRISLLRSQTFSKKGAKRIHCINGPSRLSL